MHGIVFTGPALTHDMSTLQMMPFELLVAAHAGLFALAQLAS